MRKFIFIFTLILLASSVCQAQKELGPRAKSGAKKAFTKYARAKKETDKEKAATEVFRFGKAGMTFLESLPLKDKEKPALDALKALAPNALGLDLAKKNASSSSPWSLSYFGFDEIVILKKGDVFAGFKIKETPEASEGEIVYSWWHQKGAAKKLDQAGGQFKEGLTAKGKKATKAIKANAGYDEWEYEISVADMKVTVRYIGPAYFLLKVNKDTIPFSFSGSNKPTKLKSSDKNIKYVDPSSSKLGGLKKQLQSYIYRCVPGAEPLNVSEEEAADFAQYESVQVELRRTRLSSDLIVMIRFTEPGAITFGPHVPDYITNFIALMTPMDSKNLLIASGNAPSLEANNFWVKGKFIPAKGPVKKFLRTNFPEDY